MLCALVTERPWAARNLCDSPSGTSSPSADFAQAPITCSAGTYCVTDAKPYEAECKPGCLSDESCGASERCVKCPGSNTFFDEDCTAPGEAFECPTTIEPTGQGTCERTKLPGVWCCGGAATSCTCDSDKEPADPKCVQGDLPIHWCCPS